MTAILRANGELRVAMSSSLPSCFGEKRVEQRGGTKTTSRAIPSLSAHTAR